jgi:hypothetical protein
MPVSDAVHEDISRLSRNYKRPHEIILFAAPYLTVVVGTIHRGRLEAAGWVAHEVDGIVQQTLDTRIEEPHRTAALRCLHQALPFTLPAKDDPVDGAFGGARPHQLRRSPTLSYTTMTSIPDATLPKAAMSRPIDLQQLPPATGQVIHDLEYGAGIRWCGANTEEPAVETFGSVVRLGGTTTSAAVLERLARAVRTALSPSFRPAESGLDAPIVSRRPTRSVPRVHTHAEYVDDQGRVVAVVHDLEEWTTVVTASHVAVLTVRPPTRPAATLGDLLTLAGEESAPVMWSADGIGSLFGAAKVKSVEGDARSEPVRPRRAPWMPAILRDLQGPESVKYVGRKPWFTLHTAENTVFASSMYAGHLTRAGWGETKGECIVTLEGDDPSFDRKFRAALELMRITATVPIHGPVRQLPRGHLSSALLIERPDDVSDARRFYLRTSGITVERPDFPSGTASAIRVAQEVFDRDEPGIVIGVGTGAALALALDLGDTPVILVAPEWREVVPERRATQRTVILHSAQDEVVPLSESVELARLSDLRPSAVRVVGASHAMVDAEALAALRVAVEEAFHRR